MAKRPNGGRADVLTPEQRSRCMSKIKGKDTAPELFARSLLHRMGYRFRLHVIYLPGKPDIVLPKYKSVIFVHGCFWHQHKGCKYAVMPKTRKEFWKNKLARNVERDKEVARQFKKSGWRRIVIWECETKNADKLLIRLNRLLRIDG